MPATVKTDSRNYINRMLFKDIYYSSLFCTVCMIAFCQCVFIKDDDGDDDDDDYDIACEWVGIELLARLIPGFPERLAVMSVIIQNTNKMSLRDFHSRCR